MGLLIEKINSIKDELTVYTPPEIWIPETFQDILEASEETLRDYEASGCGCREMGGFRSLRFSPSRARTGGRIPIESPIQPLAPQASIDRGFVRSIKAICEFYQENQIEALGELAKMPITSQRAEEFVGPLAEMFDNIGYFYTAEGLTEAAHSMDETLPLYAPFYNQDDDGQHYVAYVFVEGPDSVAGWLAGEVLSKDFLIHPEDRTLFNNQDPTEILQVYWQSERDKTISTKTLENYYDGEEGLLALWAKHGFSEDRPPFHLFGGNDHSFSIQTKRDISFCLEYMDWFWKLDQNIPALHHLEETEEESAKLVNDFCRIYRLEKGLKPIDFESWLTEGIGVEDDCLDDVEAECVAA